ncbi:Protein Skeletor, isoforms B/C [Sarcoptes scabiei]|nr:Protein Skeletor, isoforms B/C [Sarcoptes scabiei]
MTIFDINYISVWDREQSENLGSVIIPDELNVPPALSKIIKVESRLPNCEQLHQRLQINWEIFGPQITFELIGQLKKDDYMAFGLSGSDNSSQMLGSDIALAYMETHLGFVRDYNITGIFPCINVLGNYQGVCPDEKVGGVDNFQVNLFERQDTLTRITYRRNLQNVGDDGDKIFEKSRKSFIVWAIGKLTNSKDPGFHHIYPKHDISLVFGRKPEKNCFYFTTSKIETIDAIQSGLQQSSIITKPWGPLRLLNRTMTTLYARLGDSGGLRGYYGSTGLASPNLVWYINGLLAPILYVKRGRTYTFRIEGGNNPSQAELYNPLYITNDPYGGFTELTDSERKKYQVYAGIEFDRRGRPNPTSAGRLCVWRIPNRNDSINDNINYFDKRRADTNRFQSFIQYRNRLHFHCDPSTSAQILQWTPNSSVPDIVYYQSYTHKNMGNRIIVVDDFTTSSYAGLSFTTSSSTNSIDQNPKSILYKQIAIAIVVILMITNVSSK